MTSRRPPSSRTKSTADAPERPAALLRHAAALIEQVLRWQAPADEVLRQYTQRQPTLGARDRALLGDVLFEVLRHLAVLRHRAKGGPGTLAERLAVLAWPAGPAAERQLGAARLAWRTAVMAHGLDGLPPAAALNLPDWLYQALNQEVGDELPALVDALMQPAPLDLRVNAMKSRVEDVLQALQAAGVSARATPYAPLGCRVQGRASLQQLPLWRDGWVEVQDEGSQLLASLVDARRGQTVVDFCAGAGGKTLALGAAMRNTGHLYAFDTSGHRLAALKPRLQRAGLTQVYTVQIAHEDDPRIARLQGKADRVLVDAPCSGLGTLRRSPDLKWRHDAAAIDAFAQTQQRILTAASRLLKPGGRLVYATCSLLSAENEAVVDAYAQGRRDGALQPAAPILERAGVRQAQELVRGPYLRLFPHRHGTDGFFAAVWERR